MKDTLEIKLLDSLKAEKNFKKLFEWSKNSDSSKLYTSVLYGASKAFVIKELFKYNRQIVVFLSEPQSALELNAELNVLGISDEVITLVDFSIESLQENLTGLLSKNNFILISTYNLLRCSLPSKDLFAHSTTKVSAGGDLAYNDLIEYLNLLNYQKDKFVETPGDYSLRGSIVDFWSYSEKSPARVEFDGDFIESIRYFDPDSQRSIEKTDAVTLAAPMDINTKSAVLENIFGYLHNPLIFASEYDLNNLPKEKINFFERGETGILDLEAADEKALLNYTDIRWLIEKEIGTDRLELGIAEAPAINSNFDRLSAVIKRYADGEYKIVITTENELQSIRLNDLLSNFNDELKELITSGTLKIETLAVKNGFVFKPQSLLLLTDYQIFNKPYRTKTLSKGKYKKSKTKSFASIKKGDYVVHEEFGIGQYAGLETIRIGDVQQESMKVLYKEGGIVYVNLNYLALVKKYSSSENLTPSLSALGSNGWANLKRRTKKKIKEAAEELITLYAKRKSTQGYSFTPDTVWQKELEASFFYEDTPDQSKVTEEVKVDMEAEHPMDRLVCGDVGFGKTEIAVRSSFKAVQDSKQVAVLVPTTILAEQHFNTFRDRLSLFPVKVEMLSRFQTKKEQREVLKKIAEGEVDVVIGTHRLLSKDISFKDVGLLIIDEEHRFGVMAKEKLRSMKLNVDTLTLTATPIPRTLNLSLLGARDLSIIATPPPNRQPIYTQVATFDIKKIREWILNEMNRSGQTYFVHDRVHSIDKIAAYLTKHIPEAKIGIAHGQMKAAQLENVIHGFLNKKYDVLLSTKIIESGIDIPNVNTIIVNRADRFGLAELHQLRGRVGRSIRQAFAYFLVPSLGGVTKKTLRRLQAIEEYTEIGSGFNLSMRDLEIRGAGNLLGTEQSGFINDVGFEMYLKLIDEAVEELKQQEFKEVFKDVPKHETYTDPSIDTSFEISIPHSYMPEQSDRLNFYTALYGVKSIEEIDELKEEMIDRFGTIPPVVNRLIACAVLKFYASRAYFERVILQKKNITVSLPKGNNEDFYKYKFIKLMEFINEKFKREVKFHQKGEVMKLQINNNFETAEESLNFLIKFSRAISTLFSKSEIEKQNPMTEGVGTS